MDPVSLIVAAFVGGVAAGAKDVAGGAVADSYQALRAVLRRRLRSHPDGPAVLDGHQEQPDLWRAELARVLTEAGAGEDAQMVAAAQAVMAERDPVGAQVGKYQIDARWGRGQQFGDHNTQHNQF